MDFQKTFDQDTSNINSEHVKEEFYKWFESRGLLSDLRAYMRQLMVKALEESNKNGKTIRQTKSSTSPKLQAINLLLVDYLFHEDYLYTVSVFASEAQILESLPQYSQYVTQTIRERRWDPSSLPRFSSQETEDILDTLRLPPSREAAQRAIQLYLSGHESLLTCVVRTLAVSRSYQQDHVYCNTEISEEEQATECSHQLWSQEMQDLLLLAGVKLQHIKRMQHKWLQIIEEEKLKAKKELEEEHLAQKIELEKAVEERLRLEITDQMQKDEREIKARQSEVESREQNLTSLAEQLTAVHDDISERLSQLQLQSEQLQEKEAQNEHDRVELEQRLSQIITREEQLDNSILSIQEPSDELKKFQSSNFETDVEKRKPDVSTTDAIIQVDIDGTQADTGVTAQTQTVDPVVTVFTQTLNTEDHEQQTSLNTEPDPELLQQLQIEREKINELQEENLELRARALQQRHRIDELTNRAASLSSQLEESRIAVAVLSGQESAMVVAPPPSPPPPPVVIAPTFGYNCPQRKGAGEESLFTPRPQQTLRPDGRRRPLRFAFSQNPSPSSEESSPTDEIIQNARTRINQLEIESAAIQRNYQEFQSRLLTSDSVMFPPLDNPSRIRNPVIRVRRSDIAPVIALPYNPYLRPTLNVLPSRFRRSWLQTDENEDSSSDQASFFYETARIENLTNSRKLFSNKSFRHFDRWKQFKKKYQRHSDTKDTWGHPRQNINKCNSNTSSDDDNCENLQSTRKKRPISKLKKPQTIDNEIDNQNTSSLLTKVEKDSEFKENHKQSNILCNESKGDEGVENVLLLDNIQSNVTIVQGTHCSKQVSSTASTSKKEEDKIRLKANDSANLIESIKNLLHIQNTVNTLASNGSLAVDSLPRDSQNDTQNEATKTDTSPVLTIKNITNVLEGTDKTNIDKYSKPVNTLQTSDQGSPDQITSVHDDSKSETKGFINDHSNNDINYKSDGEEDKALDLQSNISRPLTIPTLGLVSSGLDASTEEFIVTQSVVAEQESGDKGTTSVTSGSDILRELNPSKTESSDSILSTGMADESKHSDFWD